MPENEAQKCMFPFVGQGVAVDLVINTEDHAAGLVVEVEGQDTVHVFLLTLEGALHFRDHIDVIIQYLTDERIIQENN